MECVVSGRAFVIEPGGCLAGTVHVPGDKSISHRAIMFASLADGDTRIRGFLESADCLATLNAFAAMGVAARRERDADAGETIVVSGRGIHGLRAPDRALDLGNAGTSMRLLCGLMAGQAFNSELTGDASLSRRPMGRVIEPLARMGARIDSANGQRAPLAVHGGRALTAIDYAPPVASAQIKSCVLLAGLYASGTTRVCEPGVSRDHTERMLSAFGVELSRADRMCAVTGGQRLRAAEVTVPADLSSAAFFLVGASIAADSDVRLARVGVNPTRHGVIAILRKMGADIRLDNERVQAGEPVADIVVRGASLHGTEIGAAEVELAIDECPAIFVAAACARGTTRITGAAELRVKESDRITVMADGLARLGVNVTEQPDGLIIDGRPEADCFTGGAVASHGDHRIAMAFAMAGLRAAAPITVAECDFVDTSFPGFVERAQNAGLRITAQESV